MQGSRDRSSGKRTGAERWAAFRAEAERIVRFALDTAEADHGTTTEAERAAAAGLLRLGAALAEREVES